MARPRDVNVQPCGTAAAYWRHRYHGEEPCPEDRAAWAAEVRQRRRRQGAKPRRKPRHGTYSMYATYRCRCDACREANAEYKRDQRRGIRRRDQTRVPLSELILDVLETWATPMSVIEIEGHVQHIRGAKAVSIRRATDRMLVDGRLIVKEIRDGARRLWIG